MRTETPGESLERSIVDVDDHFEPRQEAIFAEYQRTRQATLDDPTRTETWKDNQINQAEKSMMESFKQLDTELAGKLEKMEAAIERADATSARNRGRDEALYEATYSNARDRLERSAGHWSLPELTREFERLVRTSPGENEAAPELDAWIDYLPIVAAEHSDAESPRGVALVMQLKDRVDEIRFERLPASARRAAEAIERLKSEQIKAAGLVMLRNTRLQMMGGGRHGRTPLMHRP